MMSSITSQSSPPLKPAVLSKEAQPRLPQGLGLPKGWTSSVCVSCEEHFLIQRSLATAIKRCSRCREKRRARCQKCGRPVILPNRRGGGVVCEACRPRHRPRPEKVPVTCRGATLEGVTRRARRCRGRETRFLPPHRIRQLHTYRATDKTYACSPCQGLEDLANQARLLLTASRADPDDPELDEQVSQKLDALDERALDEIDRAAPPRGVRTWDQVLTIIAAETRARNRSRNREADLFAARLKYRQEGRQRQSNAIDADAYAEGKWRRIAGRWHHVVKSEIRACEWPSCGKLLLVATAHTRRGQRGAFHMCCRNEAYRQDDWSTRRLQLLRKGVAKADVDRELPALAPVPSSGRGRSSSPGTLTKHFRWALYHLWEGASLEELAKTEGVSKPAVLLAIRGIMRRLPEPEIVDARFRVFVKGLRKAAQRKKFKF